MTLTVCRLRSDNPSWSLIFEARPLTCSSTETMTDLLLRQTMYAPPTPPETDRVRPCMHLTSELLPVRSTTP